MKASELTKLFQMWTVHPVHRQPHFLNDVFSQLAVPGSILFNVENISVSFFINTERLKTKRTRSDFMVRSCSEVETELRYVSMQMMLCCLF